MSGRVEQIGLATSKECRRCRAVLATSAFRADIRYKDGFASWCRECHKQANKEWLVANKQRHNSRVAEWRKANSEKAAESSRESARRNREKRSAAYANWAKENRDKRRATDAKRKCIVKRATPPWADHSMIAKVYRDAVEAERASGTRMHVDHIIPLQHPLVCGLHVPANLQVLPGALNEGKRNKWCPIEEAQRQGDLLRNPPPGAEPYPRHIQAGLL